MQTAIGLSLVTGLPWEYFAEQEDRRVVATYVDLLAQARNGKGGRKGAGAGEGPNAPQMSG